MIRMAMEERAPGGVESELRPEEYTGEARWGPLVARVQAHDPEAVEELYQTFSRGIRFYLCRQLGPEELDDRVHDAFLIVVQAIQSGVLRDPERLMGFVRTVVRRQVAAQIDRNVRARRDLADMEVGGRVPDRGQDPEHLAMETERAKLMQRVLEGISRRDREILTRFYLYEQTQEQICTEMNLTETQFRLLKSRAKARFGELGRRRLNGTPAKPAILMRRSAAGGD